MWGGEKVYFTFHVFWEVVQALGLLFPTGLYLIDGFDNIKKSYNFGFMLVSIVPRKQLHTTPKRQELLVLRAIGRRRKGCKWRYLLP